MRTMEHARRRLQADVAGSVESSRATILGLLGFDAVTAVRLRRTSAHMIGLNPASRMVAVVTRALTLLSLDVALRAREA